MSVTINASLTAGAIISSDTSGSLQLQTNSGTTALTINTSQQVGIGTTSPSEILTVAGAMSSTSNATNFNQAKISVDYASGNGRIATWGSGGSALLFFTTSSGGNVSQNMTLDGSGNLTLNKSNSGIIFNNSSASINSTLNDYEVGTWTPTDASGAGLSFTITGAFYTKIGNMVYAQFEITYPATANTANAAIGGLPFTTSSTAGYRASNIVGFNNKSIASLGMYSSTTSTSFSFYNLGTGGGTVQNVSLSGGLITATFIYRANF